MRRATQGSVQAGETAGLRDFGELLHQLPEEGADGFSMGAMKDVRRNSDYRVQGDTVSVGIRFSLSPVCQRWGRGLQFRDVGWD
jgi:hypothetical protein